jgi:DNA repair exonuclease SbcCD ATPase subunit
MRASLLVVFVAATFDYSSYQNKYSASSGGNNSHAGDMKNSDWKKYEGSAGNWSKYAGAAGDWKKYWNGSKSDMDGVNGSSDTYTGPFRSDESILKLKGNVTALKAKEKEVEHLEEQVKKHVPVKYQDAPLGQFKKDLSDIRHMIKEAEKEKKEKDEEEKKNETKGEPSAAENQEKETVAKATALLGRAELLTATDAKVGDLEDKIKAVKKREGEIKKYVPAEYQTHALNSTKSELADLEAELKAAKTAAVEEAKKKEEAKEEKEEAEAKEEKEKEEKKEESANATSSKEDPKKASATDAAQLTEADAGAALLASERSTGTTWGSVSVCFCATVSVLSLAVAFRRRPVNIDQRPLLG